MQYAVLRIANVFINLSLNLFFFLLLPKLASENAEGFWTTIYNPDNLIAYVFISNIIASAITLAFVSPLYFKIGFSLDRAIWKRMIRYAMPILLAGIAFSRSEEHTSELQSRFDLVCRLLLEKKKSTTQPNIDQN